MDRRQWLKSAAFAAGALGTVAAAERPAPRVVVTSRGRSNTDYGPAIEALSRYAALHMDTFGLPGMTLAFADRDGFRAVLCLGFANIDRAEPVTPEHLFQIGSISKSFVALAILRLAEAGRLDLDAAVADVLPEAPLPRTPRFTVRHLLNHTSGLPDDAPTFPRGGDGRLWCGFEPGSRLSYSNTGFNLLGLILERLEGRPLADVLKARLFAPLAMDATSGAIRDSERARFATGYSPFQRDRAFLRRDRWQEAPWTPEVFGAGSIASTPGDMARYIAFLIEAGEGRGAPILSDAGAVRFSKPSIDAPIFGAGARYASGIGVVLVDGRPCLHHTGGMIAFNSAITVDAPGGVGVFASTNSSQGDDYRPRLITAHGVRLMTAARAGKPLVDGPALPAVDLADAKEVLPGPLVSAQGEAITLKVVDGRLRLGWQGQDLRVARAGPDVLAVAHDRFAILPLQLNRRGGRVVSAWWGPVLFAADLAERNPAPAPAALQALAGRYDNNDPWAGMARVIARADGLWIDGVLPLVALPDGSWRPGPDATSPERIRFDAMLNGRAQRLNLSGKDLLRTGHELET